MVYLYWSQPAEMVQNGNFQEMKHKNNRYKFKKSYQNNAKVKGLRFHNMKNKTVIGWDEGFPNLLNQIQIGNFLECQRLIFKLIFE